MKILLFGWFGPRFTGEFIAQGFESKGAQVIRISTEPCAPKKIERKIPGTDKLVIKDPGKFDLHVMDDFAKSRITSKIQSDEFTEAYQLQFGLRRLRLQDYIDRYPDIDFVFFIQNKYAWDFEGVTKPVYYYHTTIISTMLPLHAEVIKGFFYAYIGAAEEFRESHLYEYNHWYYKELIPYGCDPKRYFPAKSWDQRTIFCGFMGSIQQEAHCRNGVKEAIYDNRWTILHGLLTYIDECKEANLDRGKEDRLSNQWYDGVDFRQMNSVEHYAEFLQNCQVAINIPGNFGKINQRQFEILGSGALLLQWYYSELQDLGLKDYVNCLVFVNKTDLIGKLKWIKDHPAEADKIRLAGIQYFQDHRCAWQQRAEDMYDRITRVPTSHEQEWITFVDYENQKERDPKMPEKYPVQMFQVK
jgi:hypothetical protein